MAIIYWRVGFAQSTLKLGRRRSKIISGFFITSMSFAGYWVFAIKTRSKVANTNFIEHT